ncbi:MAG: M24 family metallopeptidase [Deltaproteobacteria bacterium]|nr:M24 family metallopeptidase [Deltaproteobacteria bacterium]
MRDEQNCRLTTPLSKDVAIQRRQKLLETLRELPHLDKDRGGKAAAVFFSQKVATRNSDVEHGYRPNSDVYFLTGFAEPEVTLVLLPGREEGEVVLFLRPRDEVAEVWNGRRLGLERAPEALGVDQVFLSSELEQKLPTLLYGRQSVACAMSEEGVAARVATFVQQARRYAAKKGWAPSSIVDVSGILYPQRLLKDAHEIERLQAAVKLSGEGHVQAMRICAPGVTERALEAELIHTFLRGGAKRHGYNPIVAAGDNACILHYDENEDIAEDGELILIDAGAEVDHLTGDITRTFPANGKFNKAQKELYQIVLDANEAAIEKVVIGNSWDDIHNCAREVLAAGLVKLGLLDGDAASLTTKVRGEKDPAWGQGKAPIDRFYMHGTGHWLGMDVHDVGLYHVGKDKTHLAAGMTLTIEPGLYIPDDDDIPAEYRNIGIRIEDNILVTAKGPQNLSEDCPKSIEAIEALVGSGR